MSASQPALFNVQEFTDNGVTLVGGRLYTYAYGTTAFKAAYTDPEGTVPQTYTADGLGGQYIALNARGELPSSLYLGAGSYDIALKRADGSTVWTRKAEGVDTAAKGVLATLLAFIASLTSLIGASLIGFIQAGYGAVLRTVQSKLRESISALDFMTEAERADVLARTGLLDVGASCDKARDYVISIGKKGKLFFPAGLYSRGTTWDFGYPGLFIEGDGRFNTVLKSTVAGTVLRVDNSRPNNGAFAFTHGMQHFTIEGTSAAQVLLYLQSMHHVNWHDINLREANNTTGVGFLINGSVCGHFSNIVVSTNAQLMTNRPFTCLVVDRDPISMERATDNTFINCIFEGATGDGVQVVNADQSLFMGGTSENNAGNGITIAAGSRMNTFISIGLENTIGFADIYDGGFSNRFLNCYTKKLIYIASSSLMSQVDGGFHQSIVVKGDFSTIKDLRYSFFAPGGQISIAENTSTRNLFNANTSAMTFAIKPIVIVPVGASPFTYTNGSGLDEMVVVWGGAVSQIIFNRGGDLVVNLPTSGMYRLAPTDGLTITHTGAPTLTRVPYGSNYI